MSAYIVEDRTINKIVSYMDSLFIRDEFLLIRDQIVKLGYKWTDNEFRAKLGKDLYDMNCKAVSARYGAEMFGDPYTYEPVYQQEKVVIAKALDCFLYQCLEGDIDETPLYKVMDEFRKALALDIVRDLPDYVEAEWE